jgi:hypothetical protein
VTFSDAKVADLVNTHFVSAWFNRSPGFSNKDDQAEKSIFQNSSEAFLTKNICTFVLTPEGRVFHYIAGYVSPEIFLRFLEDALSLRRAGLQGAEALRKLHAEKAAVYEKLAAAKPAPFGTDARRYRDVTHQHNDGCAWHVGETWRYLGRVHRYWEKSTSLPALDDVRYQYLYGNDFSEEGPGSSPIKNDPTLLTMK